MQRCGGGIHNQTVRQAVENCTIYLNTHVGDNGCDYITQLKWHILLQDCSMINDESSIMFIWPFLNNIGNLMKEKLVTCEYQIRFATAAVAKSSVM